MKTLCILTYLKCINEDYIGMFSWWAISRRRKGHSYEARLFQSWHKMSAEGLEMTILNGQWCKQNQKKKKKKKKKKKNIEELTEKPPWKGQKHNRWGSSLKTCHFLPYVLCTFLQIFWNPHIFFSVSKGIKVYTTPGTLTAVPLKRRRRKKTPKNPERLW